jgi:dipeptide/tripeptide permease
MYDFTWRSFFKVWAALCVFINVFFACVGEGPPILVFWLSIFGGFAFTFLLYPVFAPITAVVVLALREYRQTRSVRRAMQGPIRFIAGLLVAAAVLVAILAVQFWLDSSDWGKAVLYVLGCILTVGLVFEIYEYMFARKKLNTYTPSNRTDVRIK